MATLRRHSTAATPQHELEWLLCVLEASTALSKSHGSITADTIAHWCREYNQSLPLSFDEIETRLAALGHWQTDPHLRTLIEQRRQLVQFAQTLAQRQRALDCDRVYTKKALQAVDAQLCGCGILAGKPAKRSLQ